MEYYLLSTDGKEKGPLNEETLVEWATSGKLQADTKIRNNLINKWKDASEVSCLKPIIKQMYVEKNKPGIFANLKKKATRSIEDKKNLNKTSAWEASWENFKYTPAGFVGRGLSFIIDFFIVFILSLASYGIAYCLVKNSGFDTNTAFYIAFAVFFIALTMYYGWFVGFKAQTLGQLYWGIIVVRKDKGNPVFLGRAYIYGLATILFGWLTPILVFINPSKRALQDIISGTRVIYIRKRD